MENKTYFEQKMDPTIFVVDDDEEMRNSLCWLLESVKINIETYESGHAFLNNYNINRSGCILLDVRMPDMSGMELLDSLNMLKNRIPIIMLTGHGDVPMAVRAMKSGAMDFILKPYNDQNLIEQIQKAMKQNMGLAKPLQNKIIQTNFASLTTREKEIMELVVAGRLNKQIAYDLNIAISTVELHRARMMKKMQAKNLAQLVQMGIVLGVAN